MGNRRGHGFAALVRWTSRHNLEHTWVAATESSTPLLRARSEHRWGAATSLGAGGDSCAEDGAKEASPVVAQRGSSGGQVPGTRCDMNDFMDQSVERYVELANVLRSNV